MPVLTASNIYFVYVGVTKGGFYFCLIPSYAFLKKAQSNVIFAFYAVIDRNLSLRGCGFP